MRGETERRGEGGREMVVEKRKGSKQHSFGLQIGMHFKENGT